MSNTRVICFGEMLWDILPSGRKAGGAPMNVATHLQNLGIQTSIISQVGADDLGIELLDFLEKQGVASNYVQENYTYPTGTVQVSLDDKGSPSYQIVYPVAWDFIQLKNENIDAVKDADALVFGSLACRSESSRATLFKLLEVATLRIFDINLRPPFFTPELIETLLQNAEIVKLSTEELAQVSQWFMFSGNEHSQLAQLKKQFGLETIILTKGAEGVTCLQGEQYLKQAAISIQVVDTVGSGDAFLSGFIYNMLNMKPLHECLEFANATGALVATHRGAIPKISEDDILQFLHKEKLKIQQQNIV
jgi:fructokinase